MSDAGWLKRRMETIEAQDAAYNRWASGETMTYCITLTEREGEVLAEIAASLDLDKHATLRYALRILQLWHAGHLVSSPDFLSDKLYGNVEDRPPTRA